MHTAVHPFEIHASFRPKLPRGPKVRTAALAFGAVLLWATWPSLAVAAGFAPPFLVFGLAAAIGFVLALGAATLRGETRAFLQAPPRALLVIGLGLTANNVLFLHAVPRIGPSEANVLVYLWPIMLVALTAWSRGERLGGVRMLGIGIAFVGAVVVIGPSFAAGFDGIGIGAAILGGLAFAITAAIRTRGTEARDVVGPAMAVIAFLGLTGHLMFEDRDAITALDTSQIVVIGAIGVFPILLANALWDRAARGGFAAMISGIAYLTPIAALGVLAILGLGAVTTPALIGAVLVVIGALAASGLLRAQS